MAGQGAGAKFRQTGHVRPAVFVSYSHHDAAARDSLLSVLKPLCRKYHDKPLIWVDHESLKGGDLWEVKIREGLAAADVFVVLMSQYFLNSKFCMNDELPVILERQRDDGAVVLGIALGPVEVSDFVCSVGAGCRLSLQSLDCLPKSAQGLLSVSDWTRPDLAWKAVRDQIERAVWPEESPQNDVASTSVPVRPTFRSLSVEAERAPFLCNRHEQTGVLWEHLERWARRPLLIVSEGHRDDCPPEWVERMARHEFAQARPEFGDGSVQFPDSVPLAWPKDVPDADGARNRWRMNMATGLGAAASVPQALLHTWQANRQTPVLWCATLSTSADARRAMCALEGLIELLESWPDRPPQTMVVLALNLMRTDDDPADEDSALGRKFFLRLKRADKAGRLHALHLGRLQSIDPDDLEHWKAHPAVKPHLPVDDLRGLSIPLGLYRGDTTVSMRRFADHYLAWARDPVGALRQALSAPNGEPR